MLLSSPGTFKKSSRVPWTFSKPYKRSRRQSRRWSRHQQARNVVWNNSEKQPRYAWTYGCTFEEVFDLFIAFIADLLKTEVSKKLHICLGAHCSSCWNGNRTTHLTTCVLKIADVSQAQLRARLDYMRDSKEFNKVNRWAPFIPINSATETDEFLVW